MPGNALIRPQDRMIAGVVAGVANYFGWPVDRTRIAFVLLSIFSAAFPGIIVYLLLWLVMPEEPPTTRTFELEDPGSRTDRARENL